MRAFVERKEGAGGVRLNHIRYASSSSTAEAFLTTQTCLYTHPWGQTNYVSSSRRSTWTIRTAAAAVSLTALLLYMFPCLVCAGLPFTEPKPFSTKDTRVRYQEGIRRPCPRKELHCPLSGQTYNDAECRSFTVKPKTNLWTTNVWSVFAPKYIIVIIRFISKRSGL